MESSHSNGAAARCPRKQGGHGCSMSCGRAYAGWACRCAPRGRMPVGCGASSSPAANGTRAKWGVEVEAFLSGLATQGRVAASTQNQALAALLFLYREVSWVQLPRLDGVVRARRPQRVQVVPSREEVAHLLAALDGRAAGNTVR